MKDREHAPPMAGGSGGGRRYRKKSQGRKTRRQREVPNKEGIEVETQVDG